MSHPLQESIVRQRDSLVAMLERPLRDLASACVAVWGDRAGLNAALTEAMRAMPYCKFLYAVGPDCVQISDNVSQQGLIAKDFGRDRSERPYMQDLPERGFVLSDAYVSLRARRPSLTAVQVVRGEEGALLGYVGADFDLRDLPLTAELYEEPSHWRQLKGDPAIRSAVFAQRRVDSPMDRQLEEVQAVLEELIADHGVFHVSIHFSSSRATVWLLDDPYRYRLLDVHALTDPDTVLAYPRRLYPPEAAIPADAIRALLERFRRLRVLDENIYLRSGSVNVFNGMISLTFSCDGSHFMPWQEFMATDDAFWGLEA